MSVLGTHQPVALVDTSQQIMLPQSLEVTTSFVVHEQGRWFEDELRFATTQLCEKGWHVLDIGASFGLYTLALSSCVGPTGRVTSFEPSPASVRLLRESLKLNGVTNVLVADLALSDTVGTARLVAPGTPELGVLHTDGGGDEAATAAAASQGDNVLMTTLDVFKDQSGMDYSTVRFVKMDVEGCETKVLNGGGALFDDASPIVLFEVNNAGQWNGEVVEAFQQRGYGCYRLLPGLTALVPVAPADMDSYLLNLFAIKPTQAAELEARGLLLRPSATSASSAGESSGNPSEQAQASPERGGAAAGDELDSCDTQSSRRALFEGAGYCRGHVESWSVPAAQHYAAREPGAEAAASRGGRGGGHDREMWEFLDLWAVAVDRSAPAAGRWAALQRGWSAISTMAEDKHSCSRGRLLTYSRVCADLGLRTRAVEALVVLIQRGLPPEVAGPNYALERAAEAKAAAGGGRGGGTGAVSKGQPQESSPQKESEKESDREGKEMDQSGRVTTEQEDIQQQSEQASQQDSKADAAGAAGADASPAAVDKNWRDTPAGFGSAEERRSAAAERAARGSPRQEDSDSSGGGGGNSSGSSSSSSPSDEYLWSEPFLACSSLAGSCFLHASMGVERRAAWYEASLLYEAVVQQWFSLAFVQAPVRPLTIPPPSPPPPPPPPLCR